MPTKRTVGKLCTVASDLPDKPHTLRTKAPQIDEAANFSRQKVETILSNTDSCESAKQLLGYDIVAATSQSTVRVRIIKTRSFDGISKSTTNREGIKRGPGTVYIMTHRVARFLNITTGREGSQTCVWIEEAQVVSAPGLKVGQVIKSNQLLRALDLNNSDGQPIFSDKTAIVPGQKPDAIETLSSMNEGASTNTTGIFRAIFTEDAHLSKSLADAVDLYTNGGI